jgi:outer membrane lipoprotein-sorting protein
MDMDETYQPDGMELRAAEALRNAHANEPCPPEVLQRASLAVHAELATSPTRSTAGEIDPEPPGRTWIGRRIVQLPFWCKVAAAAVIIIGFGGTVNMLLTGGGYKPVLADVRERISAAKTIGFTARVIPPGDAESSQFRVQFRRPGWVRQEAPSGIVSVLDFSTRQGLTLIPAQNRAIRLTLGNLADPSSLRDGRWNFVADVRDLLDSPNVRPLGSRRINGRVASGWYAQAGRRWLRAWLDSETGEPLRIVMAGPLGHGRVVLSEFDFDAELDDELFSLSAPEGYQLEPGPPLNVAAANERDLVTGLGLLAKLRGGVFPDQPALWTPDVGRIVSGDLEYDEITTLVASLTRMSVFLCSLPDSASEWHYCGSGVKLGEPDTVVLWWKQRGKDHARGIFADLTVRDIPLSADGGKTLSDFKCPPTVPAE